MICPICGKTEFDQMQLCTCVYPSEQIVKSYVCMNCGRVELFMPQELINRRIEQKRIIEERKRAEEARLHKEAQLRKRIQELEKFLQDENHTLKELKEAQRELTEIKSSIPVVR